MRVAPAGRVVTSIVGPRDPGRLGKKPVALWGLSSSSASASRCLGTMRSATRFAAICASGALSGEVSLSQNEVYGRRAAMADASSSNFD